MAITAKPPDPHGLTAEINVTPMVDVMLVLLIIFMVVTTTLPFTAQLPAARKALPARDDRVTLGIDVHGQYWIEGVPEPGPIPPHALAGRLAAAYRDRGLEGDTMLYLKADHGVSYVVVMRAMDSARQVGVRRVAMITDQARD
jgi:biopolymer transport protein TolR